MRIEYERDERLPALAWCARALAGGPLRVRHGDAVETRGDGFVEGAWDGDFDRFDFDRAQSLAGTGGRIRNGTVVFAAPFHPLERLFVLRGTGQIFVSNSLVFLLSEAGDALDLAHPGYFFDIQAQVWRGIRPPAATLRTRIGQHVELHPCCNLELGADLSLRHQPKPLGPPPASFGDYVGLLLDTADTLARNAAVAHRRQPYRLIAACSRGYDSTAAAAIARHAGCTEGVTFARSATLAVHPLFGSTEAVLDDSGADSLRALGMIPYEYDRLDVNRLPGHPRSEFFLSPLAVTDSSMAVMADRLGGSVLVSGRHGERYWGPTRRSARRNLRELDDSYLSGHTLGEFRLRVGFFHCPIPYVGALHGPSIYRITHSAEMAPWKLGTGYYDRPIARRIAEQAGVPRDFFGQKKRGAMLEARDLTESSDTDLRAFVASEVPAAIRRRLNGQRLSERANAMRRFSYLRAHYAHWPLAATAMKLVGIDRTHPLRDSIYQYQFHWGVAKIFNRYART